MSKRSLFLAAVALALLATACADSKGTTTTTMTTIAAAATGEQAAPPQSDGSDGLTLEQYFVAVVNANADARACERLVEDEVDAAYGGGNVSEEEEQAIFRLQIGGTQDCIEETTSAIAALTPPAEAAAAHDAFVSARRAYLAEWRAAVDGADVIDDLGLFFGLIPGPEFEAFVDSCWQLQDVATSSGYDVELRCPDLDGETAEAPVVTVVLADSGWSVEPSAVVEDPGTGFELIIENRTDQEWFILMVDIFEGSPADLPTVDGVLDWSRCNQLFGDDPDPSPAWFGCPSQIGEGQEPEVEQIFPGQSRGYDTGIFSGTHVILDYSPGGYEAGRWIVIESFEAP